MAHDELLPAQPATYRAGLLQRVAATLRGGECCSLVGAGGVGKTNLARFLLSDAAQKTYFADRPTLVVLIDSNGLAADRRPAEFAVLELIIHRLIREAERRGLPEGLVSSLDRLYATMVSQGDALLGLRYLERICARLCDEHGLRLVLVFDQFEEIWCGLDVQLFLNLRYLRDEFKYRLVYLTITRERLQRIRQRARGDAGAVETFWELFEPHVFGLGMYSEADARSQIARITGRLDRHLSEEAARAAIMASGGHPQLLRTLTIKLAGGAPAGDVAALLELPEVAQECAKLWEDLLPEEQQVIRHVAEGLTPGLDVGEALGTLRLIELVVDEPPRLFSPLFTSYVERYGAGSGGVVVDPRQRVVWVDGRRLPSQLPPLEFNLVAFLASRAGEVCTRDEILEAVYPGESHEAGDDRIDTLLRRLRDSLGDDGRNPRHVITVRGVGVRLASGRVL